MNKWWYEQEGNNIQIYPDICFARSSVRIFNGILIYLERPFCLFSINNQQLLQNMIL